MKIKTFALTLAVCFVLGSLFASCGNGGENGENDTDTTAYIETEKETANETDTEAIETQPPESLPSEEIRTPIENEKALSFIEFQYNKALNAIELAKGNLPKDTNNEMIREDGRICYPIIDNTAREELEGEFTVAEVAYASGFENIGYFCRYYRHITGETPGETKKRNQNE